jgi:competence ComEA-like helix-hairpin-helix protein
VATAVKTFTPMTIERVIYATGWDVTVVLEADVNGTWTASGAFSTPVVINVNAAAIEDLSTLPMIRHVRASAIVRYRSDHGPFAVEDLQRVHGIGPSNPTRGNRR